ncbi:MAG: glucose dehydrogenase, partial [Phycisphaerae bacterium]|nr:glucose dehydrogenase [Phycisphaerae bacterium]
VNACAGCFSKALEYLAVFRQKYPQMMSKIITARYEPEQFEKPFAQKDPDDIKVVIDFRTAPKE